ncbi:MAG TPA: fumarylacetoacetate hydrolase family protein [Pyrinomonadaceae bacterium]|nr:fumarylacetoacetate hydrolase family protein [Pyrinomonadaceae bacterium]
MKICRFEYQGQIKTGIYEPEYEKVIEDQTKEVIPLGEIKLLVLAVPTKIVCVGRNYAEHAAELGNEVPKEPLLFLKAPSSLISNGENIIIPPQSNQVEHEGELAIVIGKTCKNLSENDNPLEYVLGYTCLNDVTARDIQRKDVQFTRGKSFDTFCPVLNYLETDLDISDIRVQTRVNGITKQDGKTSQMVFPVPFLLRYISQQMTLNVGDIIATGTPSGVSKMVDGDFCEVEIEGIGILSNKIIG